MSESARRIWEWWKINAHKLRYTSAAACLIVLIQTSISNVERVFPQLKLNLEAVQESALQDCIEAQLMTQINTTHKIQSTLSQNGGFLALYDRFENNHESDEESDFQEEGYGSNQDSDSSNNEEC